MKSISKMMLFLVILLSTSALLAQSNTSPLMMFGKTDPIKKPDATTQEEQTRQQEATRSNQGQSRLALIFHTE